MKRPKKRLRKKYSRKLIFDVCSDVSQSDIWRDRFFEAKEGEVFDFLDSDLASLLHVSSIAMIRKYRLRFSVFCTTSSRLLYCQTIVRCNHPVIPPLVKFKSRERLRENFVMKRQIRER